MCTPLRIIWQVSRFRRINFATLSRFPCARGQLEILEQATISKHFRVHFGFLPAGLGDIHQDEDEFMCPGCNKEGINPALLMPNHPLRAKVTAHRSKMSVGARSPSPAPSGHSRASDRSSQSRSGSRSRSRSSRSYRCALQASPCSHSRRAVFHSKKRRNKK